MPCPVAWCDRPMPGSVRVCGACRSELIRELAEVPSLAEDLELARTRQVRLGGGKVGGRGTETPLPYNERASEVAAALQAVLNGWARTLVSTVQKLHGPACLDCEHPTCTYLDLGRAPHHHPAHAAHWLHRHADALIRHQDGVKALEDILTAIRNSRRAIDRAPDSMYAGPCSACDGDLYARPGAAAVTCRWCRDDDDRPLRYEVADRRTYMLHALEEYELTAPEVARALTSLIRPIKPALLHTWVARQKLQPVGLNEAGRMLFRVGDVVDLMLRPEAEDHVVAHATSK